MINRIGKLKWIEHFNQFNEEFKFSQEANLKGILYIKLIKSRKMRVTFFVQISEIENN